MPDAIIAEIARGAREAGGRQVYTSPASKIDGWPSLKYCTRAQPGDVVLLAGKGHEHSMIYGVRAPAVERCRCRP